MMSAFVHTNIVGITSEICVKAILHIGAWRC
jgi:hypothetical protein